MAIIKCKMCGDDLVLVPGSTVAVCESCGTQQTVPNVDDEKKLTQFARANRLRAACEFDKAAGIYESIVADFPEEAEAYWGLVLCKYGIEYVDDPATGKKIPTCHRSSYDSVLDDDNYEQAVENADVLAQRIYRDEAKLFERIRKGILEVSSNEKPYDIFICYKETDEKGDRTDDSVIAQDLYMALTDKGYRVFFSRITLQSKLGEAYEPYIFAALNSAKVMLAVGTRYEYYNAVWVKNEWSRYLKICAADKSKHLIPCYKNLDPEDMPREFNHLQGADLGKMGAIQDILFNMEKYIPLKKNTTVIQERVVVGGTVGNKIASLLDRGNMALEDGDWAKADSFFEDVLNNDSKNAQAYLGKTLAQERCRTFDAFVRKRKDATQSVRSETQTLKPDTAHIEAMVKKYTLPGFVDSGDIRSLYDYDYSYPSEVAGRKQQYRNEEIYWTNHKSLSRAEKFAEGSVAEYIQQEKNALFAVLSERIKKAEAAEAAAIADAKKRYAAHLRHADEQAEALYQEGLTERENWYQELLQTAKTSSDPEELTETTESFEELGDYQDSKNLAVHCRKRAAEEQAKLDAEAAREQERLAAEAAKERKAAAIKKAILGVVAAVVVLVAGFFAFSEIQKAQKMEAFEEAMALIDQGQYEQAYAQLQELGDFNGADQELEKFVMMDTVTLQIEGDYGTGILTYTMNGDEILSAEVGKHNETFYPSVPVFKYGEDALTGDMYWHVQSDEDSNGTVRYNHTYDDNGRITKTVLSLGSQSATIAYSYEANKVIIDEQSTLSQIWTPFYSEFVFDADGRVIRVDTYMKFIEGKFPQYSYEYEYDEAGQLIKYRMLFGDSAFLVEETVYTYDEQGQLSKSDTIYHTEEDTNRSTTRYTYEGNSVIAKQYTTRLVGTTQYEYDTEGRLIKVIATDENGDVESSETYTYDQVLVYVP